MSIYDKLVALCTLITSYTTDLTEHDRKRLNGYFGPFLHIERPSGTALFLLPDTVAELRAHLTATQIKNGLPNDNDWPLTNIEYYRKNEHRAAYRYYDGQYFENCSPGRATDIYMQWRDRANAIINKIRPAVQANFKDEVFHDFKRLFNCKYTQIWHRGISKQAKYIRHTLRRIDNFKPEHFKDAVPGYDHHSPKTYQNTIQYVETHAHTVFYRFINL